MNTKPQITLVEAFVKGAKWWEYHKTGATMWQSDQTLAAEEAAKRFATIKAEEVSLQSAIKGEHRIHGVTCVKVPHTREGMLHGEDDDRPYDVDGVKYCGRCHLHITAEEIAFAQAFGRCAAAEERVSWLEQQREVEIQQKEAAYRETTETHLDREKIALRRILEAKE